MTKFTWKKEPVPSCLKVKQVYGIIFTNDFRIVLRVEDGKMKLTGGKPVYRESYEETLKREYIEELNIEIDDIFYLGYLLVEESDEQYAQVRMIGRIKSVHAIRPDIDTRKTYLRFLVTLNNVKKYLDYSDRAGNFMIDDAIMFSKQNYKINEISELEEFI